MVRQFLKRARLNAQSEATDTGDRVIRILDDIRSGGEENALEYTRKFDGYSGPTLLCEDAIEAAVEKVSQRTKDDILFARDNIRRFAEAQKNTAQEFQMEIQPGFICGQKLIPVDAVGCYVPAGRYTHVASAIMTVTTAKVAECNHITVATPPKAGEGISPEIIYASTICGANSVLAMGGVQGIAAMAFGLFGLPKANIIAGPGNQYVAEAKRLLYGDVGIDMVAGPTDSLILADKTSDPLVVATDLVSQAEHGYNSPVWLVTDSAPLGQKVLELVPKLIADLPSFNGQNAAAAWEDYAEIIVCSDREEMAQVSDEYAPEHLTVQAEDLEWWLDRLTSYGSLFLGEETTVSYGDKAAGTNHVLPTSGAARYTGGLSVHKFMKIVTWQRATREGSKKVAEATARISRLEGMEGHARAADIRLKKYFPNESFDLL